MLTAPMIPPPSYSDHLRGAQRCRCLWQSGSALVEFASALPLLFTLMAFSWEFVSASLLRSHAELAMLSLQLNFKDVPNRIVPDPLTFQLRTEPQTDDEIQKMMSKMHWHLVTSMREAGSLADSKANAALEWYSWNIGEDTGYPVAVGGNPEYVRIGQSFYRGDKDPGACFEGDLSDLQSQFDQFREQKIKEILGWEHATPTIHLGEKLIEHQLLGVPTVKYLTKRAMVFVMTCTRRPVSLLGTRAPVTTFQVFMADKEAEWSA